MTYFVGLGSFTHIIAGSIEVLFLVMTGGLAWTAYLTHYMLPVLLGNTIGGVSLVAVVNHAQVVAGSPAHRAEPQPRRKPLKTTKAGVNSPRAPKPPVESSAE